MARDLAAIHMRRNATSERLPIMPTMMAAIMNRMPSPGGDARNAAKACCMFNVRPTFFTHIPSARCHIRRVAKTPRANMTHACTWRQYSIDVDAVRGAVTVGCDSKVCAAAGRR